MRVLVVNVGSSSVKLRLLAADDSTIASEDLPADDPGASVRDFIERGKEFDAIGHRIVHGGRTFTGSERVDGDALDRLRAAAELAPVHDPPAIAAIEASLAAAPGVPNVACFDTAFHAGLPPEAALYALPRELVERHGIRRFGFHGLSYAYATRRTAELLGRPVEDLRLVICHLGAGASAVAVDGGRSVDTTMGFTPLEGLVMATRSGSVDPGLVLWLIRHGLDPAELERTLDRESGLTGLAGTGDMRELLARGDEAARVAIAVYVHRLCASVAAMTAALGGLDALVFTGGVGEHAVAIRQMAGERLAYLGVDIDGHAEPDGDGDITRADARVRTLVIRAREDLQVAAETRAALAGSASAGP